jgi:hypothetical protein
MKRPVPFRHRFRFGWEHKDWRFSLRIVCGFFVIYVTRQWPEWSALRFESTVKIGFIPWKVEEGQYVPCWTVYKRTLDASMAFWK